MVPSVSEEHMCLPGKINWQKNFRNKEGYHSMLNNQVDNREEKEEDEKRKMTTALSTRRRACARKQG